MSDVAIVGIGMHAFGRHPISGREQGAVAARRAMEDAGISWSDVEYAFGGSSAAGAADTLVSDLGLTGVPFINVANGCATGGSALDQRLQRPEARAPPRRSWRSGSTSIHAARSIRSRPTTASATGTARPG